MVRRYVFAVFFSILACLVSAHCSAASTEQEYFQAIAVNPIIETHPGERIYLYSSISNISCDPTAWVCMNSWTVGYHGDVPFANVWDPKLLVDDVELRSGEQTTVCIAALDILRTASSIHSGDYTVNIGFTGAIYKPYPHKDQMLFEGDWITPQSIGGYPLDGLWYTIRVVPEPSSIFTLFCGIGGIGGIAWRRMR